MSWPVLPLAEVASIQGGIQKQPKRAPKENPHPFLRVANVTAKGLDLADVHSIEIFDGELERYRLEPGDLLVVEGNGSASQIGRAAVWDGSVADAVHQNHLIRVRPGPSIDSRFLGLVWNAPTIRQELTDVASSSSGLHTLSVAKLKRVVVPVPPLDKQRRIVDLLEDHLCRLDAADAGLRTSLVRSEAMLTSGMWHATHGLDAAKKAELQSIAEVRLGRQRSPKNHSGDRMRPYLRAANVGWDELRLDDVKEMQFTEAEERTYRLEGGDIILTEASGSPAEVGKSAIYRSEPSGVCFQNTLLRVRCHSADPEFVQKYLLAEARSGRFMPESRGVGINHLGRTRLAALHLDVPTPAQQATAVSACRELVDEIGRLQAAVEAQARRSDALRRSLLAAAFSGRLTPGHADESEIEEMITA